MTPRQIAAWSFLANRRREADMSQLLSVMQLAVNGSGDQVKKQQDEWERDS